MVLSAKVQNHVASMCPCAMHKLEFYTSLGLAIELPALQTFCIGTPSKTHRTNKAQENARPWSFRNGNIILGSLLAMSELKHYWLVGPLPFHLPNWDAFPCNCSLFSCMPSKSTTCNIGHEGAEGRITWNIELRDFLWQTLLKMSLTETPSPFAQYLDV